jgi:MOSC domain
MKPIVQAVFSSQTHTMSKYPQASIQLLEGLGVDGDAHMGVTVKHRSRVAIDPTQANLRQVHLIHSELHDELQARGFNIKAGQMGENITTRGLDLLGLPKGTKLSIGETAVLEITGLRSPCTQLDSLQDGLMNAVLDRDANGNLIRKAGIMGVVLFGGEVKANDIIYVELPTGELQVLEKV